MAHRQRLTFSHLVQFRPLMTALMVAFGSMSAHGLTLGRLQVLSAVGEPLRAEIEVAAATAEESRELQARVATPRSFQQAGMEFNPALEGLAVNIEKRPDGRSFIVLQGQKPVQESFIDLILEAQWSADRVVRNYALLLNSVASKLSSQAAGQISAMAPTATPGLQTAATPAAVLAMPPAAASETPTKVEYNTQNVPVYRFDQEADQPSAQAKAVSSSSAQPAEPYAPALVDATARDGKAITVEVGQTASQLALRHMPAAVSLNQMLVAMQRQNPGAFIQDNVNLVRAGVKLRMPTAKQALEVSAAQAREMVIAQNRQFATYSVQLAQSPHQITQSTSREISGKVSTETAGNSEAPPVQDTLKLSKSVVGKDSTEVKVAVEREAREASEQVAALQKNVEELNNLASAAPAASESAVSASETASEPQATESAAITAGEANDTQNTPFRNLWMWGAGFAALLAFWLWRRNRNPDIAETFAPSYEDIPLTAGPAPGATDSAAIPPAMAGIDLNLSASTVEPQASSTANQDKDPEIAKLELAQLLLSKGDHEMARTLLQSVANGTSGDAKALAQQLLSQFP